MLTPWDTSDYSDSEWIAGGFPWRDMIRECIFFDTITQQEIDNQFLDSHIVQNNIKTETLDVQPSLSDTLSSSDTFIIGHPGLPNQHQSRRTEPD